MISVKTLSLFVSSLPRLFTNCATQFSCFGPKKEIKRTKSLGISVDNKFWLNIHISIESMPFC